MLSKTNKMLPNFREKISDCPLIIMASVFYPVIRNEEITCKRNQKLEQICQTKGNV